MFRKPLVALATIALILPALQQGSVIHLNNTAEPQPVTTAAGATGLSLQSAFTLLDGQGQVLLDPQIQGASFELEGDSYSAEVTELDGPWSVVMVVDASRTLGGFSTSPTFKNVKNLVAEAIGGIPDSSNIALIRFDDQAPTVVEFTGNKEQLQSSVRALTAKASGNSCMHNAVYEAANKLGGAPGRRAVIVFTASEDDCASRSAQEVAALANQNRVQIYAAGLEGYSISEGGLRALSAPTGGVSEFKDEATLGFGLSNLTAVLNNQWLAKSTVFPSAGTQSATLRVNLDDGTALSSEPITFNSTQDYIPPTEVRISGRVQSVAEGVLFNLDLVEPEAIRQLNVSIISNDTGQSVMAQTLLQFGDVNTVTAASLFPGMEYTLIISALDSLGNLLYEANAEFTYEPPQAGIVITQVTVPTIDQPDFTVEVATQNLLGAVKFRMWLADRESGAPISGTQQTIPVGEPLVLPGDDVSSGEYLVVIQALDSGDTVLAESAPALATYARPGLFESLRTTVADSPLAIAGVTAILCISVIGIAGVAWLILPKRSAKPAAVDLVMPNRQRQTPIPAAPTPEQRAQVLEPEVPSIRITLVDPKEPSFVTTANGAQLSLGRGSGSDIVIPLDSASGVSGKHLTITFVNGFFFAQDDESTYGTTIDGKPLDKGRPAPIADGTSIGLGPGVVVRFNIMKSGGS